MTRDLAAAANDNLRNTFVTMAEAVQSGECREFGPLVAASAGVPVPVFNRVFVFDAPAFDDLSAAVDWLTGREVPFWVTATGPAVETVENHRPDLDRDLVKATEQPGMAMAPLGEIPPHDPAAEIALDLSVRYT